MKPRVLIVYDYFLPAFKAGGPIQSIANLVRNLKSDYQIYIITSNLDLGSKEVLHVLPNNWIDFEEGICKVIYLSKENIKVNIIKEIINKIKPDKILVNGIYSIPFSILIAVLFPQKTILHPRGMLHPGALEKKAIKKKLFLFVFKLTRLHKRISFCVSDEREKHFAKKIFGENIKVQVAQNFPANFLPLPTLKKNKNELNLVTIALVSPMKNHLLIAQALNKVQCKVNWDIYGPIKDIDYWNKCQNLIEKLPQNIKINYLGELNPNSVFSTLSQYHMFILPSESENFGHALYEAMIAGKPVITSFNTPWNGLNENNAGYNVNLDENEITKVIESAATLDHNSYNKMVYAVRQYAINAIDLSKIKNQYFDLFNK